MRDMLLRLLPLVLLAILIAWNAAGRKKKPRRHRSLPKCPACDSSFHHGLDMLQHIDARHIERKKHNRGSLL